MGLIAKDLGGFPFYADDIFKNLLRMDSVRGEDSTGVFGVDKDGKLDLLKGNTDGYTFVTSKNYDKFHKRIWNTYHIVIGHNRKATKGSVTAKNAHPFKEKHIVLVHNGTITNAKDLNKEVEVDSHAIAHSLAEGNAVEALGKIDGAYALVWYDMEKRTLHLARNDQRPLALIEYDNCWAIASEGLLAHWLFSRESKKTIKSLLVPTEKILTFQLDKPKEPYIEIPYEEFKKWIPIKHSYSSYPTTVEPTVPYNSSSTPKFGNQWNHKALQDRITGMGFKSGDPVEFEVYDYKDLPKDEQKLLGKPRINGDVIEDIIVQVHVPVGTTVESYLEMSSIFKGTLIHARPIQGQIVWFVKEIFPQHVIQDVAGRDLDLNEVTPILSRGCSRCSGIINLADVSQSIVHHKKSNGDWRLICKDCVELSLKEANNEKGRIILPTSDVH